MVAEILAEQLASGATWTLLITLGNSLRRDDGVGPLLAGQLAHLPNLLIENAGDRPERAIDFVASHRPQKVIFIDAADFGGQPGDLRWIQPAELTERSLSSHRLPLVALIDWIESEHPVVCHCLGVQVGSMQLGEGLTPEVAKTAAEIIDWFENLSKAKQTVQSTACQG